MSYPFHPDPARDAVAVDNDERTWAVLGHISTIVAAVLSVGWLSFLGPLIIWAIYKDKSAFVRQSAAGAFNFNLLIWAMTIVGWIFFIAVLGVGVAVPVKRNLINRERLRFPTGLAAAVTLRSLYSKGTEAVAQARGG